MAYKCVKDVTTKLPSEWIDATKFTGSGKVVDVNCKKVNTANLNGRTCYRLTGKKERNATFFEKLGNIISFIFSRLCGVKSKKSLKEVWNHKQVIYLGVKCNPVERMPEVNANNIQFLVYKATLMTFPARHECSVTFNDGRKAEVTLDDDRYQAIINAAPQKIVNDPNTPLVDQIKELRYRGKDNEIKDGAVHHNCTIILADGRERSISLEDVEYQEIVRRIPDKIRGASPQLEPNSNGNGTNSVVAPQRNPKRQEITPENIKSVLNTGVQETDPAHYYCVITFNDGSAENVNLSEDEYKNIIVNKLDNIKSVQPLSSPEAHAGYSYQCVFTFNNNSPAVTVGLMGAEYQELVQKIPGKMLPMGAVNRQEPHDVLRPPACT